MTLEPLCSAVCILIAMASNYIFFVFALHTKIHNLPGSDMYVSSTQVIVKKYPINIYPAKPLVAVAWPGVLLLNLAAAIALFMASVGGRSVFDLKTYFSWMVMMACTVLWTYTFDRELQTASLLCLSIIFLSFTATASQACRRSTSTFENSDEYKPIPDSSRWWFDGIVMSYFGIVGSWVLVTLAATTNYAITYKDSANFTEAQLTGICTGELCGILCLLLILLPLIWWTSIDICFDPNLTDCIKTFYPSLSFFMFGIFLSNYEAQAGVTATNLLCILLSATAFFIWMLRHQLRQIFKGNCCDQDLVKNGKQKSN